MASLLDLSMREVAAALRQKEVSPVELARLSLDRIAADEPRLNAFARLTEARAMAAARQAERVRGAQHARDQRVAHKGRRQRARVGRVADAGAVPSPAVGLEDAARRNGSHHGEVAGRLAPAGPHCRGVQEVAV